MKIELSYGKTGLIVELPDTLDAEVTVIDLFVPGVEDEAAALLSLRKPIGCEPLAEMAAKLGPEKAAVVACDATRPVPNWRSRWWGAEAGVTREQIAIVNALGTHRPSPRVSFEKGEEW